MSMRSIEYAHRSSGWVLLDSAETLFITAERRLYNVKQGTLTLTLNLNLCASTRVSHVRYNSNYE